MALERLENVLDYLQELNEKKTEAGWSNQDLEEAFLKLGIRCDKDAQRLKKILKGMSKAFC